MERDTYKIKMSGFEGPFSLLLNLVEKRKLFINDVSLAAVTEDYLNYMNTLGDIGHAEISSFITVASTLILIKSKSLLPSLNLTSEEESDIRSLEERLRLYEIITSSLPGIRNKFGKRIIFPGLERKNEFLVFLPDEKITKESMMTMARDVLGAIPKKVFLPVTEVKKVISIEEMIDQLTERIKSALTLNFKDLNTKGASREEKVVVIVGFLAMLELVRQGIIHAVQESDSDDIILHKADAQTND